MVWVKNHFGSVYHRRIWFAYLLSGQGNLDMQQAEGGTGVKRQRVQQPIAAGGQAIEAHETLGAAGEQQRPHHVKPALAGDTGKEVKCHDTGGHPRREHPDKPNFRQKRPPTVHHTSKKPGTCRASKKDRQAARQRDSKSGHSITHQDKTQDP